MSFLLSVGPVYLDQKSTLKKKKIKKNQPYSPQGGNAIKAKLPGPGIFPAFPFSSYAETS